MSLPEDIMKTPDRKTNGSIYARTDKRIMGS